MTYLRYSGRILSSLVYLGLTIAMLSAATTKFETLLLAGIIQIYAAVLYNASVLGQVADSNNYSAFMRFRILATAQGVTENEDGTFEEQEKALAERINSEATLVWISRIANSLVSLYSLYKIVWVLFVA